LRRFPIAALSERIKFTTGQAAVPNLLQFGGNSNWNGSDGSAFNNSAAFFSSAAFGTVPLGASAAAVNGGDAGSNIIGSGPEGIRVWLRDICKRAGLRRSGSRVDGRSHQ
jgi:hypothetical protein